MTQEEKQLLFIDLCGRLPYEVIVERTYIPENNGYTSELTAYTLDLVLDDNWSVKPYLRSMSTMTTEETLEFIKTVIKTPDGYPMWTTDSYDWLNKHHFDYRGLIPKKLALESPEDMYKTE